MLEKEALLNTTHLGDVRDMTAVLPDALFTRKTRDASKTWARRDAQVPEYTFMNQAKKNHFVNIPLKIEV